MRGRRERKGPAATHARPDQITANNTPKPKGITGRDARHRGGLRASVMIEADSHDDRRGIGVIFDEAEAEADGEHGTKWLATQLAYAGLFSPGERVLA